MKHRICTGWLGVAFILFAIGFNLPYSWLGANFDYPDILRRPPGEILQAFHAGGVPLMLAWPHSPRRRCSSRPLPSQWCA